VVHDRSATLRTVQYTYDGLARLREARYLPGLRTSAADADLLRREQFTFDRAGNRTQQSSALNGGAPTVTSYSYNAANQMTSAGAATLMYDDNGNLISGLSGANWDWDRANRATFANGSAHKYDGLGNCIEGSWGRYLLDLQPGLAVVLRTTGTAFNERYIHAGREILAQQTYSDWSWTVQDGLGSVRGMIDNSANVFGYANYDSFGNVTSSNSTAGFPYGFTGEWHDFAVSVYLRARHYDPAIGIFVSEDPLETPNRYAYVGGNPVNRVDPSGMVYERPEWWGGCNSYRTPSRSKRSKQTGYNYPQCMSVGFMYDSQITPDELKDIAANEFIDPYLLAMIVENEYENRRFELSFNSNQIRWLSLFFGSGNPSFGIAQIQQQLAVELMQRDPYDFEDLLELTPDELGDRIHTDPRVALRFASAYISNLYVDILWDLRHEEANDLPVRIFLGTGGCSDTENCTISQRQLDELITLAYNQGWTTPGATGILDLLRTNRSGTTDWYLGIVNTIAQNQSQINNVWQHLSDVTTCLT
jgi:RHS repeat-associated protein